MAPIQNFLKSLKKFFKKKKSRKKSPRKKKPVKRKSKQSKKTVKKKQAKKKAPAKKKTKKKVVKKKARRPVKKKIKKTARKAAKKKKPAKNKKRSAPIKKAKDDVPKGKLVGKITHYFSKIGVVVLEIESGKVCVGDQIHIKGSTSDFIQEIASLQIESIDVRQAKKGDVVGLKVKKRAKEGDRVYRLA